MQEAENRRVGCTDQRRLSFYLLFASFSFSFPLCQAFFHVDEFPNRYRFVMFAAGKRAYRRSQDVNNCRCIRCGFDEHAYGSSQSPRRHFTNIEFLRTIFGRYLIAENSYQCTQGNTECTRSVFLFFSICLYTLPSRAGQLIVSMEYYAPVRVINDQTKMLKNVIEFHVQLTSELELRGTISFLLQPAIAQFCRYVWNIGEPPGYDVRVRARFYSFHSRRSIAARPGEP